MAKLVIFRSRRYRCITSGDADPLRSEKGTGASARSRRLRKLNVTSFTTSRENQATKALRQKHVSVLHLLAALVRKGPAARLSSMRACISCWAHSCHAAESDKQAFELPRLVVLRELQQRLQNCKRDLHTHETQKTLETVARSQRGIIPLTV